MTDTRAAAAPAVSGTVADEPHLMVGGGHFLAGLGFSDDNRHRAALVREPATGKTDIAVVDLIAATDHEADSRGTHDAAVPANGRNRWTRAEIEGELRRFEGPGGDVVPREEIVGVGVT